ncbi:MAG: hypothetical protein AVDCRST_MAG33-1532 [uncultured Thermomicrobiales bacterium]|uniref:Uncharacterized protein n=1 Tax=uncultured Thermomicrobiales bacterium TaxID=1645740 RepID=A0A6J4USZ8_9BACT|nr:MAG: hypothetical protein AVDCRST_MAG33-1532 [uncultured Thermomicrobiales bacterium]
MFDERTADGDDDPRDYVVLDSRDNTSRVFIEGSDAEWNDTDECVDVLLAETLIALDQAELLDGPDGEPYRIREEDRSAVAYLSPVEGQSTIGQSTGEAERVVLVDCRADATSGVIVGFTDFSISEDPYFEGNHAEVEAVIDSLVFREGPDGEESTPVAGS